MNQPHPYSKIQTDETLRETIRETPEQGHDHYPFYFYNENTSQFDFHLIDWHWHEEFEFIFVEDGEITLLTGAEQIPVKAGEAVFLNSKAMHAIHSVLPSTIPNFLFPPSFLGPDDSLIYHRYVYPFLVSGLTHLIFSPDNPDTSEVIRLFREIIKIQRDDANELTTLSLTLQLWSCLHKQIDLSKISHSTDSRIASQARLQLMLQYIQTNYASPITLEDIAAVGSLSKSSVLNLFRKYLHTSPVNYLIDYRLRCAANLLSSTELDVNRISERTGFENPAYFCRIFKRKYQKTPSQYRRTGIRSIAPGPSLPSTDPDTQTTLL